MLLLNLILGAAALVASVTGFGYALVATPFLVLLYPPSAVVPVVLISWFPIAVFLVYGSRRQVSPGRVGRALAGAVLGIPVGVYGLASLPADTMRALIGLITILASLSLLLRPSRPLAREGKALVGAGVLSGILGGASGMSGPPIVLLGLKQRWQHEGFRADLLCYFFLLHVTTAVVFGNVGLLTGATLAMCLQALPGVAAGYGAGMWLRRRVDGTAYRRLAIVLVVAGGVLALALR